MEPKPVDCTCPYPRLVARNGSGHATQCAVYQRWKLTSDPKERHDPRLDGVEPEMSDPRLRHTAHASAHTTDPRRRHQGDD